MTENKEKFSTKLDQDLLAALRAYSKESRISISDLLAEAVKDLLEKVVFRPKFRSAMQEVIEENKDLLKKLAK